MDDFGISFVGIYTFTLQDITYTLTRRLTATKVKKRARWGIHGPEKRWGGAQGESSKSETSSWVKYYQIHPRNHSLAILRVCDLFGMVSSRDPNSKLVGDLQLTRG